ncbi:MAG TPA: ATP cone domain-containing protein, partial [Verrucomicrobiae bacterium]|nr:ATP cone domain-containing protein [Verrucomicrobiae bacterium]
MVQANPHVSALTVKKRNGQLVPFYDIHIFNAVESAFKAQYSIPLESELDAHSKANVRKVTDSVVKWCEDQAGKNKVVFIEDIQNAVIRELKEQGHREIAERYSAYRRLHDLKRFESERITVQKRDGRVVPFMHEKIVIAVGKAFSAMQQGAPLDDQSRRDVIEVTDRVVAQIKALSAGIFTISIEEIQDIVEKTLMKSEWHDIARRYIVYRDERRRKRDEEKKEPQGISITMAEKEGLEVRHKDGTVEKLDIERLKLVVAEACHGIEDKCSVERVLQGALKNCFKGMPATQLREAMLLAVRPLIEMEPAYTFVAARFLLRKGYSELVGKEISIKEMRKAYPAAFRSSIELGVKVQRLSPKLQDFDLDRLGKALKPERDLQFQYMGLQTLYDRYFLHDKGRRFETPQIFWMRVAMGLAVNEGEQKNERAIEFYDVLSSFRFVSSTPTLFNAGSLHSQLSSCFLTTVSDDL